MKILFAHDNRFIRHEDTYRSVGNITATTWRRFLPHVDHIHVVSRRGQPSDVKDPGKLNIASHPCVSFELVERPPYHPLDRGWKETYTVLDRNIKEADAVVARIPSWIGNLAAEIAYKNNKPLAGEIIACPWDAMWNYGRFTGKVMAIRETLRLRMLVKKLDFAVYVTDEFLQRRYPTPSPSTSASNVELIPPADGILERRLDMQVQPTPPVRLGQIGSLAHRIKGWETAIRALSHLQHRGINAVFEILGPGDPAMAMRCAESHNVQNRVIAKGVLPSGQPVLDWLDSLDVYVHPSRQEGLPRSVIEAMSRALPCVCAPAGGTPELIDSRFIFPKNDDKRLADLLTNLIRNPELMHEQSRTNHNKARKFYIDHLEAHRDTIWGNFFRSVHDRKMDSRG